MDIPWKMIGAVDQHREYLALLSYLPLNRYSKIPFFLRFMRRIQTQLGRSSGVMGHSMRAKFLSRQFWTLSAWDSSEAFMDFVSRPPHSESMKAMAPFMGKTKFAQWKVPGSAIPLQWDDAIRRMS